jgi:hypothetical protein
MSSTEASPAPKLFELFDLQYVDALQNTVHIAAAHVDATDLPDKAAVLAHLRQISPDVLTAELRKMLDVSVTDWLLQGWTQIAKVRKAIVASRTSRGSEQFVELSTHSLKGSVQPRLVLAIAGMDWYSIDFKATLEAKLKSAVLSFVNGALASVQLGELTGSVRLECEGQEIKSFSRPLKLLPKMNFVAPDGAAV